MALRATKSEPLCGRADAHVRAGPPGPAKAKPGLGCGSGDPPHRCSSTECHMGLRKQTLRPAGRLWHRPGRGGKGGRGGVRNASWLFLPWAVPEKRRVRALRKALVFVLRQGSEIRWRNRFHLYLAHPLCLGWLDGEIRSRTQGVWSGRRKSDPRCAHGRNTRRSSGPCPPHCPATRSFPCLSLHKDSVPLPRTLAAGS